jgi:hypothetical protein
VSPHVKSSRAAAILSAEILDTLAPKWENQQGEPQEVLLASMTIV